MRTFVPLLSLLSLLACAPVVSIETGGEWTESTTTAVPETSSASSGLGSNSTTGPVYESTGGIVSETDPNTSAPSFCSDGLREPWEECDDGNLEGGYGGCEPDCTRGPHCGDGVIDEGYEICDGPGCPVDCGLAACEEISP